ncbi:MAG: NHL repeat-containing protein [Silicimonas sp.]
MKIAVLLALMATPALAQDAPGPFASFDLASEAVLADPHDLAIGPDGRLYVADKFGARIAVFDPDTLELIEMLGEGYLPGVHDISFGPDGSVAVAVTGAGAVAIYESLDVLGDPPDIGVQVSRTEGALLHSNGDLYAMAGALGALVRFRGLTFVAGVEGHPGAHDVAEGADGSVWVADNFNRRLVRYSPDLERLQVLDDRKFGFVGPRYMDVTEFGHLVVADQDAHRILLIDPEAPEGGALLGVLGDGTPGMGPNLFDDPEGVAVDGNRFFISDSDNNRIVRYSVVLN